MFTVVDNVLTQSECSALVARMSPALRSVSQALSQYHPDGDARKSNTEYHLAVMQNAAFADTLWERLQASDGVLEAIVTFAQREGRGLPLGLTPRLRLLRYTGADRFDAHYDRVVPEATRACESLITVLVYLNDGAGADFKGGETLFLDALDPQGGDGIAVVPRTGRVVLFEHALFHSGSPLKQRPSDRSSNGCADADDNGCKYVMRTDVLFRMQKQRPSTQRV
jgi:2OG-Fe(II) oxygenase superfamily